MTSATSTHWYVIQCRAKQNQRAQDNLENQGFTCFHPLLQVEKMRAGRRQLREESLFPGYLFIQLDETAPSWHTIRSTRGVLRMVAFGQQPVPVPNAVIEQLQQVPEAQGNSKPVFTAGDILRIEHGPFANLETTFERFDGDERVVVLLNMLQKQQQLTMKLADVTAAN